MKLNWGGRASWNTKLQLFVYIFSLSLLGGAAKNWYVSTICLLWLASLRSQQIRCLCWRPPKKWCPHQLELVRRSQCKLIIDVVSVLQWLLSIVNDTQHMHPSVCYVPGHFLSYFQIVGLSLLLAYWSFYSWILSGRCFIHSCLFYAIL